MATRIPKIPTKSSLLSISLESADNVLDFPKMCIRDRYTREICNMLDFLGKRLEDITGMDLRYYYGVMRERRGIKMSTMQTRLHYLSSFWDFMITEDMVSSNPVKKVGL